MSAPLPTLRSRRSHAPARRSHTGGDSPWPEQLGHVLRPACFPARQDDLLATLVRAHAPSHLMWRLARLPRTRVFSSVEEVVEFLDSQASTGTLAEPL